MEASQEDKQKEADAQFRARFPLAFLVSRFLNWLPWQLREVAIALSFIACCFGIWWYSHHGWSSYPSILAKVGWPLEKFQILLFMGAPYAVLMLIVVGFYRDKYTGKDKESDR